MAEIIPVLGTDHINYTGSRKSWLRLVLGTDHIDRYTLSILPFGLGISLESKQKTMCCRLLLV